VRRLNEAAGAADATREILRAQGTYVSIPKRATVSRGWINQMHGHIDSAAECKTVNLFSPNRAQSPARLHLLGEGS